MATHIVNTNDWTLFKVGQGSNFAGFSTLESYIHGDLDGDLDHDLTDFVLFRNFYDQANGAGSFEFTTQRAGAHEPCRYLS